MEPDTPINLLANPAEITKVSCSITWSDGAYNGGKPILDYLIEYDQGTGFMWTTLVSSVTQKEYQVENLIQGVTYKFRVLARNEVGYSSASEELEVLTAIVPEAPIDVVTSVVANDIVIDWNHPSADFNADYGASLIRYSIVIQSSDEENFYEELNHCDGSNTAIIDSHTCSIPISVLLGAPFDLSTSVYAKVLATNVVGDSQYSIVGNGAYITMSYPPDAPTNLLRDEETTSMTVLAFTWTNGASNGG